MRGLENWTILMDFIFLSSLIRFACATSYFLCVPVLLCYNLVDMRVNLNALFVIILSYLVLNRRAL